MKEVDALYKSPSVTPQIFSDLFEYYEDDKNFIDTLTELINIYNIDSKLKIPDFIIALTFPSASVSYPSTCTITLGDTAI